MKLYYKFKNSSLYKELYIGSDEKHHPHAVSLFLLSVSFMIIMFLCMILSRSMNTANSKHIFYVAIVFSFIFGVNIFIKYLLENHFFASILLLGINNLIAAISFIIPNHSFNDIAFTIFIGLISYFAMILHAFWGIDTIILFFVDLFWFWFLYYIHPFFIVNHPYDFVYYVNIYILVIIGTFVITLITIYLLSKLAHELIYFINFIQKE